MMKRDKNIIKSFQSKKRKVAVIGGIATVCVVVATIVFVTRNTGEEETVVYRETTVEYGDLTVGITEDSEVNIGTIEQTFDLDISALVDSDSSNSQSQGAGGGGAMGGMQGGNNMMTFSFGESVFTSQSQEMAVEKVHVTVGQEVAQGDVLYTLSEASVNEIRSQLETDVADTLEEYESLQVEQQADRNDAKQGYDTYALNGKLAQLVYDQTVLELNDALTQAEENLLDKQNQYNENLFKIQEVQLELVEANTNLKEAQAAVSENYENRFNDAYYYTVYKNTRDTAKTLVEKLDEELETLLEENEKLLTEIATATREWNAASRNLETGKLQAQQTLETDQYYASVASEWYNIQTEGLDNDSQQVYKDYLNAVEKLESFDGYISGTDVIAENAGVITDVKLSVGDSITTGTSLVTLYDQDEVTMSVSIGEDDYQSIEKEGKINISFTAYPDVIFEGVISEVSDAEYDSSSGELYYTITVTIQGDTSGLYEGMTGEVTFVTKETQKVIYVSNRAIFREGTRSYVKVRDEAGKIQEKDVVTGFSDGVNVQITEGLAEGDIVLIESKVSES